MRIGYNLKCDFQPTVQSRQNNLADRSFCSNFELRTSPYYTYGINFTGMKKNQFEGVNALVVDKFKAPIEKFRTVDYLYEWADEECEKIYEQDFPARSIETTAQRIAMIDEWKDYLENENQEYSPTEKLLIMKGVTKELKPDNDNIPPVLNKGVLANTIYELKEDLKQSPKINFDFNKTYKNKLREFYMGDIKSEGGETKWIIIPSQKKDADNFDSNVEKLKTLSHSSWCTKSNNAEPYLSKGDFHIYLEDGQPKLGVRFEDDKIMEVQGEKNNSKIPVKYLDVLNAHIENKNYEQSKKVKEEIGEANALKAKIDAIKKEIEPAIIENDYARIFNHFGIEVTKLPDGTMELSHFDEPAEVTYDDLGINENNLFKNVSRIKGDAKFCRSTMTDLRDLKEIGGNADFSFSKFKTLGGLEKIGGDTELKYAFGLEDLGNVEEIGGDLVSDYNKITGFTKLKRIGGSIDLCMSSIESLGSIEDIGGNFKAPLNLKDLGKLRRIGGNGDFSYVRMDSLGELQRIEGDANFDLAEIRTLNKLEYIGGNANFTAAEIEDYGALKNIKGYIKTDRGMRMDIVRHMINNGNIALLLTLNDKSPRYDKDDEESYIAKMTKKIIQKFKDEGRFGFSNKKD